MGIELSPANPALWQDLPYLRPVVSMAASFCHCLGISTTEEVSRAEVLGLVPQALFPSLGWL